MFLAFAVKTARRAGHLLNSLQPSFRQARTKATELDLVTKADGLSEKLIISNITRKFPNHKILAEEQYCNSKSSGYCVGKSDFTWVIDPLDGTTNYSHQFPIYCVSIALVKGNKTILGVVYNPNLDEMFYASPGQGAYLNGKRIRVSKVDTLNRGLLCTGFPYIIRQHPGDNFRNFQRFCLTAQAIRRAGSAALDLCYLAAGRFDGFWERELKPWDTAAGALIVVEAGGKISDFKGGKYNLFAHREILGSNGLIHKQMIKVINNP
ncbi:MAG: inositol monophosphatase [Planctomycetes bacterium]|nr:inositol monophosphatase [Planctomycetota bacterium]